MWDAKPTGTLEAKRAQRPDAGARHFGARKGMPEDRVVTVRHPSPMLFRRKRKRKLDQWFVATDTPVALRAGSREDLGETYTLGIEGRAFVWRVFEGQLWYQVSGLSNARRMHGPGDAFGVDDFETFLATGGLDGGAAYTDLDFVTRRTPLRAVSNDGRVVTSGIRIDGGGPPHGIEIAEIHEDGRASAVTDLRRFMDERVRIVEDVVLVRAYDPLVSLLGQGWAFQAFPQARETPHATVKRREPLGYRPDVADLGMAWECAARQRDRRVGLGLQAGALDEAPYGSDTVRLLAGFAVSAAMEAYFEIRDLYEFFLYRGKSTEPSERAMDLANEAWAWSKKASLGRITAEEAGRAVDAARGLTEAVADCHGSNAAIMPMIHEARFLVRRFDEFEWPMTLKDDAANDMTSLSSLTR
ncbi:hypothetical protein [Methylorubrum thiocyanatum]|uniref:hypothetical protein n=1 Tax=Methylorubrum thiocyanatum TaxID=47958 RepID=UPI00398C73E1